MLLSFAKAAQPSRVHRPAYPDFVSIREIDAKGRVIKECRFLGIYTSIAYSESVREIPYIRRKVAEVAKRSGFTAHGHLSKELVKVLEVLPRDDLFQDAGGRAVQHRAVDRADPGAQQGAPVPAFRPLRSFRLRAGLCAA